MASNGGEEDFLDLWSDTDFPSLEQLLLPEDNPMAETLNDGADHPGVSGAQVNNAQAPTQQSAQTAVATPHAQGNSNEALESLTVLNLKPEKTIYMLKKSEAILREGQVDRQTPKFKATSVPFNVLRIGQYEVRPQYQSNLIAKWYYTRKRLIWEVLENFVTKKIEISWSDISGIRVDYGGNVEILEIEV
ncbi:hypothetical protein ACJRO7_011008 [Eucalyptus globulus]|uniref:TRF2/HOY1 PH-like domain-containing protein n=1 Tax=Eucalyptus globulus TaxID=34317 RepID=A0ABD3LIE6_EUCGL